MKKREQDPVLWTELFGECDPVLLEKFMRRFNRQLYEEFRKRALAIQARGRKRYGAQTIFESLRYDTDLHDSGGGMFKISNSYVALYSRVLVFNEPEKFPPEFFGLRAQAGRVHGAD